MNLAIVAAILALGLGASPAMAQTPPPADGQNCQDGYYTGARPGATHYTKDEYLWVVTPEFARRFCMPPAFVDASLKGAEAVAFRLVPAPFERCGFGGNKEVCSRGINLSFEIYYDMRLALPAVSDTKFAYRALYLMPYSKHLIAHPRHMDPAYTREWMAARPGAQNKFETSAFGLSGVRAGKIAWPIVTLGQWVYVEEMLPGLNLLVLEGSTGHFNNPRMERQNIRDFVIEMRRRGDKRKVDDLGLSDFAHVIHLPRWFSDKVREADNTRGTNWEELVRRAFPEATRGKK
jgi:hypothetical protein